LKCRQFVEMIGSQVDRSLPSSPSPATEGTSPVPSPIPATNGSSGGETNGNTDHHMEEEAEEDTMLNNILRFGTDLHSLSQTLKRQYGSNEQNKKMLREAFSLLAYSDPRSSPVGWQLHPSERENVCQQLNNAIVISEMGGSNHRPPLETIIKHSKSLLRQNGQCGAWLIEQL